MSQEYTPFLVFLVIAIFHTALMADETDGEARSLFSRFVSGASDPSVLLVTGAAAVFCWTMTLLGQMQLVWFLDVIAAYFTLTGWMAEGLEEEGETEDPPPDDTDPET